MANRILPPLSLKSATWYPQFQETSSSISLPESKKFGITKRVGGIPAMQLLSKVTNIRAQYADVNNNNIPYNNTWLTIRAAEAQAVKGIAEKPFSKTFSPGEQIQEDFTGLSVTTNDILAINNYIGFRLNGQFISTGLNYSTSIPSNGTIRFIIRNDTGGNINLTSGYTLFAYYFHPVNTIAQNSYDYGIRKGTPVFSEFNENGIPFNKIEEIYSKIYDIIKSNDSSVQTPADANLYSDYFEGLNGYSTDISFMQETTANVRTFLSSESAARGSSAYYTTGAFNYRNRLIGGYFDGIRIMYNGSGIFSIIASLERAFVALSTRKTGVFGWGSFEGIDGSIDGAMWQRLPFPTGDIIRLSRAQGSYDMTEQQAFFSLFIGNTYVMWNDNGQYSTDIDCWDVGSIGGFQPWKTLFQATGSGEQQQYDANNPSHPQRKPSNECEFSFSDSAAPNLNGGYSGVYLYDRVKNRCNTKIKYATFSYVDDTGTKSGYNSGNTPVLGSKGDGSVSTFGNSNPGQHNIVDQWEYNKPLVYEGYGTEGTVIVILNLRCGIAESVIYNITTTNNGVQSITHVGRSLGIYRVD